MHNQPRAVRRLLPNLLLLAGTLVFIELILQLASTFSPPLDRMLAPPWKVREAQMRATREQLRDFRSRNSEDPRTENGSRNTGRYDHDEWGFRNARVPEQAEIVALGDSHTYGTSVAREQAWPHLLANLLGASTYNMGFGGYGPAHGLKNLREALSLKPRLVIYASYFGNDFYDSYRLALTDPTIAALASSDLVETSRSLEALDPIGTKASKLFRLGREEETQDSPAEETGKATLQEPAVSHGAGVEVQTQHEEAKPTTASLKAWISDQSKLYGLLRAVAKQTWKREDMMPALLSKDFDYAVRSLGPDQLKYCSVFEGENWRTILTAPYRNLVLQVDDGRIRLGVEISKAAIKEMSRQVEKAGAELMVVLLPTKERVFASRVKDKGAHIELEELVRNEDRLRNEMLEYLVSQGIAHFDPREALEGATQQPYFYNADGHPNPYGHEVIAKGLADYISNLSGSGIKVHKPAGDATSI